MPCLFSLDVQPMGWCHPHEGHPGTQPRTPVLTPGAPTGRPAQCHTIHRCLKLAVIAAPVTGSREENPKPGPHPRGQGGLTGWLSPSLSH